jgi:hypothetical protein
MLFSYPNVWNTCLLILRERGYRLYLLGDPDELGTISRCSWNAEKDGMKLRADNPIELLGLAGIHDYHRPSKDTPYWWRVAGPSIFVELEAEWRTANAIAEGTVSGYGDM